MFCFSCLLIHFRSWRCSKTRVQRERHHYHDSNLCASLFNMFINSRNETFWERNNKSFLSPKRSLLKRSFVLRSQEEFIFSWVFKRLSICPTSCTLLSRWCGCQIFQVKLETTKKKEIKAVTFVLLNWLKHFNWTKCGVLCKLKIWIFNFEASTFVCCCLLMEIHINRVVNTLLV